MNETQKMIVAFIAVASGIIWLPVAVCLDVITLAHFEIQSKMFELLDKILDA